jgi:hypothetical protein
MKNPTNDKPKTQVKVLKTPQEFLEFFEKIPADKWNYGSLFCGSLFCGGRDTCCALGHLGVTSYDQSIHTKSIVQNVLNLAQIIDPNIYSASDDLDVKFDCATTTIYKLNDKNVMGRRRPKSNVINALKEKIKKLKNK